ncbi:MAG TPA: roadblock/LC7 domain-containing protein [Longimicrobiales bacterium]
MIDVYNAAVQRLSRVSGVRGALLVDAQAGVPVVAELAEGVSGTAVAALAASLFQRTAQASEHADFGRLTTLQVDADEGHMIAVDAGEVIIVVVAERAAQLGLVRLEAHRAAESLA